MDRFFDWFQIAALISLVCLGIGRGVALYASGVRVVVIDRERSLAQALGDLLLVACFLSWAYEILAYAWPLEVHVVPQALGVVLVDAVPAKLAGALAWAVGLPIYALALRAFGSSWRLGIDRETPGPLVTEGLFAWTRNPIYVSLDLLVVGTFLLQGRLLFLLFAVMVVGLLHGQIRREERFLADAYGDPYRAYCARVGRYLTWRVGGAAGS